MQDSVTHTILPNDSRSPTSLCPAEAGGSRASIVIFVIALTMHLPWLGISPIAGTEGHRIFPAHAMVQTGWWSVPMLFGQPLLSKPPLHHWLIALSETIAGRGNVFVWRLPSAINGAVVCAVACWFAARWFGRIAGWISGFCAVGLITIWGQAHVADIDATNTLAAALTALCGIELFIASPWHGHPPRVGGGDDEGTSAIEGSPPHQVSNTGRMTVPRGWVLIAGAALAATTMTKGPGGFPIIIGVWLWGLIEAGRGTTFASERRLPRATRPGDTLPYAPSEVSPPWMRGALQSFIKSIRCATQSRFWLPWVVAAAVFGLWMLAAGHALSVHGLPIDWKGVQEGASKSHPGSVRALTKSLLVLPLQLLLFALPVSLALPLCFHSEVRGELRDSQGKIAKALLYSILLSWAVCVLTAMDNPRYAYPTLIPLCPLAGAVAVAAARGRQARELLGLAASASAILFVIGAVALTKMGWATTWGRPALVVTLLLVLITAGWTIWRLRSSWQGAWGLAALAILPIVPFSIHEQLARIATSGIRIAPTLEQIVGTNGAVAAGGAVTSKPETFYYARVQLHFYKPVFTPEVVEPGIWVMLDQAEHKRWLAVSGVRLERDRFLCKWGPTDYYLAWYAAR